MTCEVIKISEEIASKYPTIKQYIEDKVIWAIDFGYVVNVSWSWLVDLTPEQEKEFELLTEELNKK